MTTIEEYKTLCEQQRQLIEPLLSERRAQSPMPVVVPATPPAWWQTPIITSVGNDGRCAMVKQMDQGVQS